ncbi:MAG: trigger factor [Coriobacteriia bacterium]|nr:trigger factor [Coriobacteriia bacterium]
MNTNIEVLEDNKVKISVEVEAEDITARIKREYKNVAKKYKFPGFRPGKAPRPVIDNMVGAEYVLANVTEGVINDSYPQVIEANDLVPLFKPEYEFADGKELVVEGEGFSYSAIVTVKPAVELSSYEAVEVEIPAVEATAEEVDAQLEQLRNYYPEYKDANANTKIKEGQVVVLTSTVTNADGEKNDTLSMNETQYELGTGLYPAAFDAELIGLKKGNEKQFDVDFTDAECMVAQILGEDKGLLHFDVKVDSIKKKIVPEIDDELAKNFGFDDLAAMRTALEDQIRGEKEQHAPARKQNEALMVLASRVEGEVPEKLCEIEEANLLQSFFRQLQQNGISFDQYLEAANITSDQFKEDTKAQAADLVRQDLALDAWARHFDIPATDEDVTAEFENADVDDPAAVQKEWLEAGRLPEVREGIKRAKALEDVLEKAVVTEVAAGATDAE